MSSPLVIRQLRTADGPAVRGLHDGLSERDTYLRFFTLRPARLPQFVDRLVSDVARRAAIGAFVDDHLVGVASYEVAPNSIEADIALVVAHQMQTNGIGTTLLQDLVSLAQAAGLRRFTAEVLVENTAMLRVLRECGLPCTVTRAGSVNHVVVELDATRADVWVVHHGEANASGELPRSGTRWAHDTDPATD